MRKQNRLENYNYGRDGAYYVTFCVKDRHELLGKVIVGSGFHARPCTEPTPPCMELSDLGIEVQKTIKFICENNKKIEIPKYVIMPNHVHMIVFLNTVGNGFDNAVGHVFNNTVGHGSPTLQSVIGQIKSYTTKRWNEMNSIKYQAFWQRSFYDHIIRNKAEYRRIWQYIDENPAKWSEDEYYAGSSPRREIS